MTNRLRPRWYLWVVICACLLAACDKPKKELDVPREKVIALLADIHLAEQAASMDREHTDSLESILVSKALRMHKIDSVKYLEIKEYLEKDLATYFKIEEEVHSLLKSRLSERD